MQLVRVLRECRGIYSMLWLCTCLAVFGIVSRSQGFKAQTGDTTSTECFAWSNSVWKPTERGRWGLPSMGRERSSGIFSTSSMLKWTNASLEVQYVKKGCTEQLLAPRTGAQNLTNALKWCRLRQCWFSYEDHKFENEIIRGWRVSYQVYQTSVPRWGNRRLRLH